MSNIAEHPQAIDLAKRISASELDEKSVPVQLLMPGMGQLMGVVRMGSTPGLFILTSNVEIKGKPGTPSQQGVMDISFTADKPTAIIHPDLTQEKPEGRIIT